MTESLTTQGIEMIKNKTDSLSNIFTNIDYNIFTKLPSLLERAVNKYSIHPVEIKVLKPKVEISSTFSEKYAKPLTAAPSERTIQYNDFRINKRYFN